MKLIILVLVLIFSVLSLVYPLPAQAALCRHLDSNQICIHYIKRSAKYYWEYRVSIKINGVATPIEKYNCRDRFKISSNGTIVPFENDPAGDFICSLFPSQKK